VFHEGQKQYQKVAVDSLAGHTPPRKKSLACETRLLTCTRHISCNYLWLCLCPSTGTSCRCSSECISIDNNSSASTGVLYSELPCCWAGKWVTCLGGKLGLTLVLSLSLLEHCFFLFTQSGGRNILLRHNYANEKHWSANLAHACVRCPIACLCSSVVL